MKVNLKEIVENLIDNFLEAGDLAIQLREKGLIKKIKPDNTPVSNGDLEVNKFISKKISEVTPNLPIISEETSENKDNLNLKISGLLILLMELMIILIIFRKFTYIIKFNLFLYISNSLSSVLKKIGW